MTDFDTFSGFPSEVFTFLEQLAANNNRPWFAEHKHRYEALVQEPAFAFIRALRPRLFQISPEFEAIDRKTRGSLLRIYRDMRFSPDGEPYKTSVGLHFRHRQSAGIHAPAFYVHIEPNGCFLGVGSWRPASPALRQMRQTIVDETERWEAVIRDPKFTANFQRDPESLRRIPRGFPADHPAAVDLKRKSHVGMCAIEDEVLTSTDGLESIADRFSSAQDYMRFLCDALELPF